MSGRQAPPIAFLGFVERSVQIQDIDPRLLKYNILGLKQHCFSIIYPYTLRGSFALALYEPQSSESFTLVLRSDSGSEIGTLQIALNAETSAPLTPEKVPILKKDGPIVAAVPGGWTFFVASLSNTNFTFNAPGIYHLYLRADDGETQVGSLALGLLRVEPLTEARIAAIKSDPHAMKAVRIKLHCNQCQDAVRSYAGLERQCQAGGRGVDLVPDTSRFFYLHMQKIER